MNSIYYVGVFFVFTITQIQSSKILVIFPTTAQSHYRVVRPLIHGLLDRGHEILSITNFPDANERVNLSHINIAGFKSHSKFGIGRNGIIKSLSRVSENINIYATILNLPPIQNLLQSGQKFDLIIAEYFTTTSIFTPIASIVDAPIIGFCPMIIFPFMHYVMGMETTKSYMPNIFSSFTNHMSYFQRIDNFVRSIFFNISFNWILTSRIQEIYSHYYGIPIDSLSESLSKISMILTNNYHSMFMNLPRVPGIVEVGGIHVEKEQPLPQDLKDFISNADYGVILFSLGSVVSESSLGTDKLNNIIKTFSKLKQKIIMKFDDESNTKIQLPNVKIVKWFPQRDLLAHPKVLLFISHAGLMSVIETIHCGKPMVAIPIFGDQPFNAKFLVEKQVAVSVNYRHLKNEYLYNAINEAMTENYMINSKKLQLLYIDRPHTPLETAIFWSEYVIRHKNESKELLKSSKIHLNYFQTYLIDVFVALILPLIIAICIISWTIAHIRKN